MVVFSLGYFYHNYFFNFPIEQSTSFQYPFVQAVEYVLEIEDDYDQIVFSKYDQAEFSYMYYLFYSQTDPGWYSNQGGTESGSFDADHQIGKYQFRAIDFGQEVQDPGDGKKLIVGNALGAFPEIPEGVAGIKVFETLDGRSGIKVVAH